MVPVKTCAAGDPPVKRGRCSVTMVQFDGVKVFSATKARDREELGNVITQWLKDNPQIEVVDREIRQSSDNEFHCLTIALFYRERAAD